MNTYLKFQPGILICLFTLVLFSSASIKNQENTLKSSDNREVSVASLPMQMADPAIFSYKRTYYLYGTGGDSNHGFLVYTSTNLKTWEGPKGKKNGYALTKGDSFGTAGFWAPQVFQHKGKIYMAYTANEQLAIAESDSPLGPFKQTTLKNLSGADKQIDPFVFFDTDGKIYLYHVRLQNGNKLFVAELKADLSDIKPETSQLCLQGDQAWENTASSSWPVTEGPTVIKHNKLYYLFYSANDFRSIDYAVGYAVGTSPFGPWIKYSANPILSSHLIDINGSGHGDFFRDVKGNWKYVFHLHATQSIVSPRKTAIINAAFLRDTSGDDVMKMDRKTVVELTVED